MIGGGCGQLLPTGMVEPSGHCCVAGATGCGCGCGCGIATG
jgi:hypothetical protein